MIIAKLLKFWNKSLENVETIEVWKHKVSKKLLDFTELFSYFNFTSHLPP